MKYVDGFVIPVLTSKLPAYRQMARMGARVWKKHGALAYFECVGDDLDPKMYPNFVGVKFPRIAKAGPDETVVISFIVYKSRDHRDRVNAKVMADPVMNDPKYKDKPMPFDVKRMAYGGFKVLVEA